MGFSSRKRYPIIAAAAGAIMAIAVPMSASAGSSAYSPTTLASWNQVHSSSLVSYTNTADALVSGTIATIHEQVLNSANQFVAGTQGPGGTTVSVSYGLQVSARAGCWWNYPTQISGQLYLTCSIYEIINTLANGSKPASTVNAAPSAAAAPETRPQGQIPASSGSAVTIPIADQHYLAAKGIDSASGTYLGVVDDSKVWSFTTAANDQCLVAILPNEIMGSACATKSLFESNGLSLQFGASKTSAPTKMYLLPNGGKSANAVSASNASLGAAIRGTTPSGVFVTIPSGDTSSHVFATPSGKKIHLHEFPDWAKEFAGH